MKTRTAILTMTTYLGCWLGSIHPLVAGSETNSICEYATLRWGGRDNSHVIYAGGKVEFLASKFKGIKKPDRADDGPII